MITDGLIITLTMASTCIKHPGFREEEEWRLLHVPEIIKSLLLRPEVESVNGVPQKVYKLKLPQMPAVGLPSMTLTNLLDRVIVGPTAFPDTIAEALKSELDKKGVKNAKVVKSNIPLRI